MEGVYKQPVTVEKVEFNASDKKRLQDGEKGFTSEVKLNAEGVFSGFRSVNNMHTVVEEGMVIITFANGSQKLLISDEEKANLTISKKSTTVLDEPTQVVIQTTDGTQTILNPEKSAELLKNDDAAEAKAGKSSKK